MEELQHIKLVWLAYHLAATFALGVPLVLLTWASIQKEASIVRLLSIYWKNATLMAISMLLLTGEKGIGFLISFIAPLLMVTSVWFWIDLNEELEDLPYWRALPLTVKLWRWALSWFGVLYTSLGLYSLSCLNNTNSSKCLAWIEVPQGFHQVIKKLFDFLFGANWTEALAAFVGYLALLAYIVGFLQWLLIRLPKQGRIAGNF